jgi:hypothetical protein
MYAFETVVAVGREAEQVTTAFYRFLELKGVPRDADVSVHTEILGAQQRCVITLWSEEAGRDFRNYLNRFQLPQPLGLARRFGPSRFDGVA